MTVRRLPRRLTGPLVHPGRSFIVGTTLTKGCAACRPLRVRPEMTLERPEQPALRWMRFRANLREKLGVTFCRLDR